MKPGGGGKPEGRLLKLIERDFGSYDAFEKEFRTAAISQFGSGWAWLICKNLSFQELSSASTSYRFNSDLTNNVLDDFQTKLMPVR